MKTYFFLVLFCLSYYFAAAQKETAIWYFGENAGLDFNTGAPVALTDGQLTTSEGCAVISDEKGSLLFYTDGITVFNRKHQVMTNGSTLKGHFSSTNSALIIEKPGDRNGYFIFTTDAEFGGNGLRYSEVNMALDDGMGGITSQKNILLENVVSEKLTAIEIPDEDAYWVLAHKAHSNEFLAYKVSNSGVHHSPVRSAVGPNVSFPAVNSQGQIKISPDGKKMGVARRGSGFELYDFNNRTGQVSNFTSLALDQNAAYGIEFSPNSRFLYTGSNRTGVIQYDLEAPSIKEMIDSRITLINQNWLVWGMQLALDGKIYVATSPRSTLGSGYLDVINKPNRAGSASEYQRAAVFLEGRTAKLGLPPFMQSYFYSNAIIAENFCAGNPTNFSLALEMPAKNVHWDFGDGNSSNLANPVHTYSSPGEYDVSVSYTADFEIYRNTSRIAVYDTPEAQQIDDINLCLDETGAIFDLSSLEPQILGAQDPAAFNVSFFSSEADAMGDLNPLPLQHNLSMGEESIFIRTSNKTYPECYDISKFKLVVHETPVLSPVKDWIVCDSNGSYDFDLLSKTDEILGGQDRNRFTVSFFTSQKDADEGSNPVNVLTVNTAVSPSQQVYFRIDNIPGSRCYKTGHFKLEVGNAFLSKSPQHQAACDEGGGFGFFDTSRWISNIIGEEKGYKVNFVTEDGRPLPNPLPAHYRNSVPNSEKIIARVESELNKLCITETSFNLIVNTKPQLQLQETYSLCEPETHLELSLSGEFDSWEWRHEDGSLISNTSTANLTAEGNYTITVRSSKNGITCEETYSLNLLRSQAPTITGVNTQDRTGQNFIEVLTTGSGQYEYSIDGINFQDSNYFPDLQGGTYTVVVRDKNGCGLATYDVTIIDYPDYFTPNDDGYNDRWQLTGLSGFPEVPVYIFDRYGKLLKQMSSRDSGWDGTFNGVKMPSDDYWFSAEVDGQLLRGHFTLLR